MLMWLKKNETSKNQMSGGGDSLEVALWSLTLDNRTWNAINSMKSSFTPKRNRNFDREKESTNSVKNMMKFSFGSAILPRGTWIS